MSARLSVVVGGQYGSEGKGAIAGHLSKTTNQFVTCVRIGGPNAGHTVLGPGPTGHRHPWRLRTIPVAAVTNPEASLIIAAGSEIDPTVLEQEANELEQAGYTIWPRLMIDPQATVLEPHHIDQETQLDIHTKIGSTGKGIGAARAARIMRTATLWKDHPQLHRTPPTDTTTAIDRALNQNHHVIIEGTQGYGLGLHAGHYPQCTSNNARAIDFLAMTGTNPWSHPHATFRIYVVARVNPIRVAGNSGPLNQETTWEALGLEPELTTVTRKIRRVGNWDPQLVKRAAQANGTPNNVRIALTMLDHAIPEVAGWTGPLQTLPAAAQTWIQNVQTECSTPVTLVGTGPDTIAGSTS